jgi:hypothetical protein
MPGSGQVTNDNMREFIEWLLWMTLFGLIIGVTLWVVCVVD